MINWLNPYYFFLHEENELEAQNFTGDSPDFIWFFYHKLTWIDTHLLLTAQHQLTMCALLFYCFLWCSIALPSPHQANQPLRRESKSRSRSKSRSHSPSHHAHRRSNDDQPLSASPSPERSSNNNNNNNNTNNNDIIIDEQLPLPSAPPHKIMFVRHSFRAKS